MQVTRRNLFRVAATSAAVAAVGGRAFAWEEALVAPFRSDAQVRRSLPRAGMVILSSNENPYGPLPRATEAMRSALPVGNRYAFRQTMDLVDRLPRYHPVAAGPVVAGHG